MRSPLVLLVVAALGCGSASLPRRSDTLAGRPPAAAGCDLAGEPRICAIARIDDDTVTVQLVLDPAALPPHREIRLHFAEGVHVERLAWPRGAHGRSLGRISAPVEVRYRATLSADGEASFRRPGGWHLRGRAFLPEVRADGRTIDPPASLRLDAGERPVWTAVGDERPLLDAASLRRLIEEAYEIGPLHTVEREVGPSVLRVASSSDEPLDITADTIAETLRALSRRLGPLPFDGLLVVFHRIDGEPSSTRFGASVVHASPDGVPADPLFAQDVLRGLGQLWVPGLHEVDEVWLRDGVPDYLALVTTTELLSAPPTTVARVVLDTMSATNARAIGRAAGFCLDVQLQEAGSSLGAVLRTALTRDPGELGAEELLEDLAAIAPASAGYLAALLGGGPTIPLDECLERVGLRAQEVTFEGWSDHAVLDALGIESAQPAAHAQALRVDAVLEGSALEPGDALLEVSGVRVGTAADLAWALRDAAPGERVQAVARRAGQARAIELTVPDLDAPREPRTRLELTAVEHRE